MSDFGFVINRKNSTTTKTAFIFVIFLLLFSAFNSFSQSPESFSYHAVVRDASDDVIENQTVSFRMSVLQGSPTGSVACSETHAATTNAFGLANLSVGEGTPVSGDFSAIYWGNDSFYLKVEIDPAGGNSYTEMGSTQLLSVPYALHAKTGGSSPWSETGNNVYNNNIGNVGIGASAPTHKLQVNDGAINVDNPPGNIALRVDGKEALWYNGTYFSWGFGGTYNFFADKVGIGTTTPSYNLHTAGNTTNTVACFANASTGATADGIRIEIGGSGNPGSTNDFMQFRKGSGTFVGYINGNGSEGVNFTSLSDAS